MKKQKQKEPLIIADPMAGTGKTQGLCFRCEHRAMFLEKEYRPRHECGDITSSKYMCYMYTPVRPMKLIKDKHDDRPQFGMPLIASRSSGVVLERDELKLSLQETKDGGILYWMPKKERKKTTKKKK